MIEQIGAERARKGLRQRFFAWMHANEEAGNYNAVVDPYKRKLFAGLSGTVLEIGAGTGENFPFYPAGIRWIGIEPNAYMQARLLETAQQYPISGELRTGVAEKLPADDASVDAVISTLVLCSVSDQAQVLREIMRVLRPGGRFIFIEHVAAPHDTAQYRNQRLIKPLWKFFADGCNPDRDTADVIKGAGFAQVEIERFDTPIAIASPHIAGWAVK